MFSRMQAPRAAAASTALALLVAFAAPPALAARTVQLRLPQGSAANAVLEVWPGTPARPFLEHDGLSVGDRSCPDKLAALLDELGTALPLAPLARTVAGPDGVATLPEGIPADAWISARTSDGAFGAHTRLPELTAELRLLPLVKIRFRIAGADGLDLAGARAFTLDEMSGAVEPLVRDAEGNWAGRSFSSARRLLLVAVPEAALRTFVVRPDGEGINPFPRTPGPPAIEVNRPRPIDGVVMAEGRPVGGAEVKLTYERCTPSVQTDDQGRFHFERGAQGAWWSAVEAQKSGRLAVGMASAGAPLVLELQKPSTLEVTLLRSDGVPLKGVELGAGFSAPSGKSSTSARSTTDSRGRARLTFPGDGRLSFINALRKHALSGEPTAEVRAGQTTRLTLRAEEKATLELELLDATGAPVPGASVDADFGRSRHQGGTREWPSGHATTDPYGTARITWLAPGPHFVSVYHSELGTLTGQAVVPGRLSLRFPPKPILELSVVDTDGGVVPGLLAYMELKRPPQNGAVASGKTDERGKLRRSLESGEWNLRLQLPGYAGNVYDDTLQVADAGVLPVTVPVKLPPPTRVTVVDVYGKPIRGAQVHFRFNAPIDPETLRKNPGLMGMDRGWGGQFNPLDPFPPPTGPDGTTTFLAVGPHWVWALADEFREGEPVAVVNGKAKLVLQRCPVAVGRVLGPDGKPLSGIAVTGGVTDAQGRYRVALRSSGLTSVHASTLEYLPASREIRVPADPIEVAVPDIQLAWAASLSVVVTAGGAPGQHILAQLEARGADGGGPSPRTAFTDSSGRATFRELAPGDYVLSFKQNGIPSGKPRQVTLRPRDALALTASW
jgi:uncharacterized GH25 family protein